MKTSIGAIATLLVLFELAPCSVSAHPASGIAITDDGQVLFVYSGHGVCKLDSHGRLSCIHPSRGGHWMCLDPQGAFSHSQPKYFERISADGVKPALIFADGGSPIAVLPDGNLYYVSNDETFSPGGMHVTRNSPKREFSALSTRLDEITEKRGVTGLAAGPDGALYIACPNAVFKAKPDGTFSTVTDSIHLDGCDVDYPDNDTNNALPYVRGLAVDNAGVVFAAGTACHCVIKIAPGHAPEIVLKAERPWSPTGVALHRGDVYVLEYSNATGGSNEGWWPRVRKIAKDGKVSTLVTVTSETPIPIAP